MIINENLYSGPSNIFSQQHSIYIQLDDLNLIDGQKYTISVVNIQGDGGSGHFDLNLYAFGKYYTGTIIEAGVRKSYTFEYSEGKQYSLKAFNDRWGKHMDVLANFIMIKIEKGDTITPYLPHKSKVKPYNQAIFVAGGYSKRCIHSKSFGGGVC